MRPPLAGPTTPPPEPAAGALAPSAAGSPRVQLCICMNYRSHSAVFPAIAVLMDSWVQGKYMCTYTVLWEENRTVLIAPHGLPSSFPNDPCTCLCIPGP